MRDDSALEAALRRAMEPRQAREAAERIARRLESRSLAPQNPPRVWWPGVLSDFAIAPAWPRIAALACAAVLGISIGLSSFGTRIAADLDLVRSAPADESQNSVFDLDVGLRP
ncbi:MAG TPA: hypothetical protein VK438_01365 [Xanthobacteraceae bacterium]|nr:hypothetical protein [Xanthobacteraceae bacterium]